MNTNDTRSRNTLADRAKVVSILLVFSLLMTGCSTNGYVKIDLPSRTASFRERVAAYKKYKVVELDPHFKNASSSTHRNTRNWIDFRRFENGKEIGDVAILEQGVEKGSTTYQFIQNMKSSRLAYQLWWGIGFSTTFLVGGGMIIYGFNQAHAGDTELGISMGLTVILVGGLIAGIGGGISYADHKRYQNRVLENYNKDLMQRLRISPKK